MRLAPDSAPERSGIQLRRDERPAPRAGTSRWYHDPFVRWTSGRLRFGSGDDGSSGQLSKAYAPAEFEHATYERWLAADVFAPDGRARPPTPPSRRS